MNLQVLALGALHSLILGGDPAPDDCSERVPRFELVLREHERGYFYEDEIIVIEIWLVDVCPAEFPRIDTGIFFLSTECVEPDPDCTFLNFGPGCCVFTIVDPAHFAVCFQFSACESEVLQTAVVLLGRLPPCVRPILVPPDGRVFLGTTGRHYGNAPEGEVGERFRAGSIRPGTMCLGELPESYFEFFAPSPPTRIYPLDSEPVELRVRRRPFIRGDANQDGVVDLSDAVRILNVLFLGEPVDFFECASAADIDDNNRHEITDAIVPLGPRQPRIALVATLLSDCRSILLAGEADPPPHRPRRAASPSSAPDGTLRRLTFAPRSARF